MGGADSVWTDAKKAADLCEFDAVIAINDIGAEWPHPVDWWVTLHPEKFRHWRDRRADNGYHMDYRTASHVLGDMVLPHLLPGCASSGSSGLFAVRVALQLGATHVVLAGVPMQAERAHFFNLRAWDECEEFRTAWQHALPLISSRVRSLSGWTRELLGEPATGWLDLVPETGVKN